MPKCWVCGKVINPKKVNSIYGYYGHRYYCKKVNCQKRFTEDAGDPPPEPDEHIKNYQRYSEAA